VSHSVLNELNLKITPECRALIFILFQAFAPFLKILGHFCILSILSQHKEKHFQIFLKYLTQKLNIGKTLPIKCDINDTHHTPLSKTELLSWKNLKQELADDIKPVKTCLVITLTTNQFNMQEFFISNTMF
jgi:hypothetical protein